MHSEKFTKYSFEFTERFKKLFGLRTRADREYWMLDGGLLDNPEETLKDLSLDLDDDFFWYSYKKKANVLVEPELNNTNNFVVKLQEVYRIHKERKMTIVSFEVTNSTSS